MRILNEKIARKANKEHGCAGRIREGRFISQALLNEKALMACIAYVDLNLIRARMANTPEKSTHTSIKRRCEAATSEGCVNAVVTKQPRHLQRFVGNPRTNMSEGIPFRFTDCLQLINWTGGQKRR